MRINFKILTDCIGRELGLHEEQRRKVSEKKKQNVKSYTFRKNVLMFKTMNMVISLGIGLNVKKNSALLGFQHHVTVHFILFVKILKRGE